MNWYKRYIYAGLDAYNVLELVYKLKVLGIEHIGTGSGDHEVFQNTATGDITELPIGGKKSVNPETIKQHVIRKLNIPFDIWKKLPKKPKKKDIQRIWHLLPWNQKTEEEIETETPVQADEPWLITYKQQLEEEEKRQKEKKRRDEEETRLLEKMIQQDELNKLEPSLMSSIGVNEMNWYKQAQQIPTMEEIEWAVDDILLNKILTEEDYINIITSNLEQIAQGSEYDQALPKAAQVAKIPTKKKLLDEIQNQTKVMDLSNPISYKNVAEALNTTPEYVKEACITYGINIKEYSMKRRFYVEKIIIDFMSTLKNQPMKINKAYDFFSRKYNHNISYKKFGLMLRYNNLISKLTGTPENIYTAFEGFIRAEHQNSGQNMETMIVNDKINDILDKFLNYYGDKWGFTTPIAKDMISKFLMTKIQIRNKSIRNEELGQFFNQTGIEPRNYKTLFSLIEEGLDPKSIAIETGIDINYVQHFYDLYTNKQPPVVDESHPSYFLNNQEPSQLQVAEIKMNWYKKANKWKDNIPGGRADGKKPSDYNKRSVEKGKSIEYEHTNDPSVAREIAIDHLEELPKYYNEEDGLPAMEKKLEKKKPARRGRYNGGLQRINL